jgi:hypothetical protein
MSTAVATIFQQILTEIIGAESGDDRLMVIIKIIITADGAK